MELELVKSCFYWFKTNNATSQRTGEVSYFELLEKLAYHLETVIKVLRGEI